MVAKITVQTVYKAILTAAKNRKDISYGEAAALCDADGAAQSISPKLNKILPICKIRD